MEFRTAEGQGRYAAVVAAAAETVVGLDFDGVLSPIVADPAEAVIHPDGPRTLVDLAAAVKAIAVVTGRPARQVVQLGGLEDLADRLEPGQRLLVLGQYGHERWDSDSRAFTSAPAPEGLDDFLGVLPGLLAGQDAADAFLEDKQIAVAVHTRRLGSPQATFDRLLPVLTEAAEERGLHVEPGRLVIEVRAPGVDKGQAVRRVSSELSAGGFVFAGDDLGDLPAFRAVTELREQGMPALLVCSGSEEQQALVELSDIVVDGPGGVLGLLGQLATDARAG